ncbi:MAG: hypothetical protein H8E29_17250 [Anaerolineales bacterium]|uniref:Flippase-like domain-containing protein n=1 Tax=Candidatus Desulfolinea nitratireducens TaxID=2841698 RepID=A0A8J6TJX8_9CHLR|nr:hypothetical protein [Candidatus Desulfolinea nitratireducens]
MSTSSVLISNFVQSIKKLRAKLSPVFGVIILGIFIYWIFNYRKIIISTFGDISLSELAIILILFITIGIFTVFTFVALIRDFGYPIEFIDGHHALYYSQLASMIPGGIWGYAGLAGVLWSKGVSKVDSILVIFQYTLIMLTACAVIGVTGLASIFGWGYAIIGGLPFIFLLLGRNWLDTNRRNFFPGSSSLPSNLSLLKILIYGIIIWIMGSICFTWLLYSSIGYEGIPFWTSSGAYAAGYLGGYIAFFAPSGIGVSEGLVTLILSPYVATEKVMAVAISFRIIQTIVIWCNILVATLFRLKKNKSSLFK